MKIQTRDFGELQINPEEIIFFRSAIYGFEDLTQFVLLYDDDIQSPFTWLQSTQDKDVCFILVAPELVGFGSYELNLPADSKKLLELEQGQEPVCRVIAVIPADFKEATVNLKSPIVINTVRKCAAQVILEQDYPIRARLMPKEGGEQEC